LKHGGKLVSVASPLASLWSQDSVREHHGVGKGRQIDCETAQVREFGELMACLDKRLGDSTHDGEH